MIEKFLALNLLIAGRNLSGQDVARYFHKTITKAFVPVAQNGNVDLRWQPLAFWQEPERTPKNLKKFSFFSRHYWRSESTAFLTRKDKDVADRRLTLALSNSPLKSDLVYELESLDSAFSPIRITFSYSQQSTALATNKTVLSGVTALSKCLFEMTNLDPFLYHLALCARPEIAAVLHGKKSPHTLTP